MRLVVTGTQGQVVRSLLGCGGSHGIEVIAIGRPVIDLAIPETLLGAFDGAEPDVIVSCAAYTAVNQAETERDLAMAINAAGAGAVAAEAARLGIPIIHLSTDYVFDGSGTHAWREDDRPAPLSVYGQSKLAGELAVQEACANHAILRTSWVYSPFGLNFVKTMFRLAGSNEVVRVVEDQIGNPTSAHDIAAAILTIGRRLREDGDAALRGIFHLAGTGETSWADFAEAVFSGAAQRAMPNARVERISTAEFPTPAPRPANSRLDCTRLRETYGISLPEWRTSLANVLDQLI